MLVYVTRLHFRPATLADALDAVISWLSVKTGRPLTISQLQDHPELSFGGGHRVRLITEVADRRHIAGIRYVHPDREISGRQWAVELGFRKAFDSDELECTVLLQTSEVSARVNSPIQPSRPGVVSALLSALPPAPHTTGLELATFGENDAHILVQTLEHADRTAPLVLVSPTPEGTLLVNPHRLRETLAGIAEVGLIQSHEDAVWLSRRLGQEKTVWGGAVKIFFPPVAGRPLSTRYYLSDHLRALIALGQSPDIEVTSAVLHRTNLPLSRAHLSLEKVREEGLRARLLAARAKNAQSAADAEEIRYLEEILEAASETEAQQKVRIEQLEAQNDQLEDDNRRLGYDLEALKHQLAEVGGAKSQVASIEDVAAGRQAMARLWSDEGTLEDALVVLDTLYRDSCLVLPSAWDSVKRSRGFRYVGKAHQLMLDLVGPYRDKLAAGESDTTARGVLGNAYAATESESVRNNNGGRARRTFLHKGRPTPMFAHLKIGIKDSAAETMRLHFHWDAEEQRIVIGHCGPHLDFD